MGPISSVASVGTSERSPATRLFAHSTGYTASSGGSLLLLWCFTSTETIRLITGKSSFFLLSSSAVDSRVLTVRSAVSLRFLGWFLFVCLFVFTWFVAVLLSLCFVTVVGLLCLKMFRCCLLFPLA